MATSEKKSVSYKSLVFLRGSVCFPPTVVANVRGLYPRCESQLHSLEYRPALTYFRLSKSLFTN